MSEYLPRHWLIIDVPLLCNRAFYAMPNLKHGEVSVQVVYAVFKELVALMDRYDTPHVVLCFDAGKNKRNELFPDYKKKRKENRTPEEIESRKELHRQMKMLRRELFAKIGFKNVLWQLGYESDDLIARACEVLPNTESATIVSSDHDLLQLLRKNIHMFDPRTQHTFTYRDFMKKYGFAPDRWALVKEIGGCSTDEVPGCAPGLGEGRAIAYIQGKLKGKFLEAVESAKETRERNRRLTLLPYEGTKKVTLATDTTLSEEGWWDVCESLGFSSLLKKGRFNPFSTRMTTITATRTEYMRVNKTRRLPKELQ